jgi:hypothetical protein
MKRLIPALLSTSVACATLTSALVMAQLQEVVTPKAAQPQDGSAVKPVEANTSKVKVYKSAPRPKGATAPVEKKAVGNRQVGNAVAKLAMPAVRINNQDGQVQQMMMQLRPILRAEFHVIRVACQPTPEQSKAIAHAAEQTLRDATKKYVETMRRPMTASQRAANDPHKLIEEGLVQAIKSRLPAEQVARYQEELTKRAAGRKRLALRNLVARLDHDLVLSPDQRDKLGESLSAHWDDAWGQSLEMFLYDNNYFPPISDQYVVPFLNESQKKIWGSAQRFQGFFGGFGMMGGIMVDDPLEDEELREARLAAARKDANEPQNAPAIMMEMMKAQIRVLEKVQRK